MEDLNSIDYDGMEFAVPQSLDELQGVSLSTQPPAGALLGFDGSEWKDILSVLGTLLENLDTSVSEAIDSADSVIEAFGKLQGQFDALNARVTALENQP